MTLTKSRIKQGQIAFAKEDREEEGIDFLLPPGETYWYGKYK